MSRSRQLTLVAPLIGTLVLAGLAQYNFSRYRLGLGLALYGLSIVLFLDLVSRLEPDQRSAGWLSWRTRGHLNRSPADLPKAQRQLVLSSSMLQIAVLLLAGLVLAALGGSVLLQPATERLGTGVALVVLVLLGLVVYADQARQLDLRLTWALDRVRGEPLRAALVMLSFALACTTVRLLKAKLGYGSYWDVFTLWVISLLSFVAAFIRLPRLDLSSWLRRYRLELLAVIVLTSVAAALRFVALGAIPNVVSGDEGQIGMLALSVLKGHLSNMMGTTFGHSTMYIFAMAGAMKLFGVNAFGLRLTSAVGGALTVPALYVLARRTFNARVALIAAALLTVSHFHLHFSRIIVAGSVQDALFATVAFYFFFTGLEERSPVRFVLSALVIGVHLYIYMGARLVILLLPVYVAALLITDRKVVRDNLGNLLAFVGALLVVSAPMALWAVEHWADFMARANQIGVVQSGWLANEARITGQSQLRVFASLLIQVFLTVNYFPATGFYNSPLPMLDFMSGATFMLGLAYSFYRVTERRHLLLNAWFWSGVVVGGALVVLSAQAAYRIMIVFPAVCIFAALGWDKLIEFGSRAASASRVVHGALTAVFIVLIAVLNLKAYFLDYAPSCRYEDWGTRFASHLGKYLGEVGSGYRAYLFGAPRIYYGIHKSVDFLSGGVPVIDVREPLASQAAFLDPNSKAVFIFIPERENELALVERYMPGGEVLRIYDCKNLMMTIYRVDSPLIHSEG